MKQFHPSSLIIHSLGQVAFDVQTVYFLIQPVGRCAEARAAELAAGGIVFVDHRVAAGGAVYVEYPLGGQIDN